MPTATLAPTAAADLADFAPDPAAGPAPRPRAVPLVLGAVRLAPAPSPEDERPGAEPAPAEEPDDWNF